MQAQSVLKFVMNGIFKWLHGSSNGPMNKGSICSMRIGTSHCSNTVNFTDALHHLSYICFYEFLCPYGGSQMTLTIDSDLNICILKPTFCFIDEIWLHYQVSFAYIRVVTKIWSDCCYVFPPLVK